MLKEIGTHVVFKNAFGSNSKGVQARITKSKSPIYEITTPHGTVLKVSWMHLREPTIEDKAALIELEWDVITKREKMPYTTSKGNVICQPIEGADT